MKEFFVYYRDEVKNVFVTLSSETHLIKKVPWEELIKMKPHYAMLKGYEPTKEGLVQYMRDFKIWMKELKGDNRHYIDVLRYDSLDGLVTCSFYRYAKGRYEHHEKITAKEMYWFDLCYNAGIQYCKPGKHNSYGYDFQFFYLNILDSKGFFIPNKAGKEVFLKEIPKKEDLQEGFYRVRISCDNNDFRKIFSFSKHHVYNFRSLYHALKYRSQFDVKIELITTHKTNAYIYDKDSLEPCNKIFHDLKKVMTYLKGKYPKNRLVKFIASGVWGHLSAQNIINKTADQINDEDLDVGVDYTSDYMMIDKKFYGEKEVYQLLNCKNPCKTNLRLKPFLTAYARNKTARVALKDLDSVIRIHTDGLVFNKKHDDFVTDELKPEGKTTGLIDWVHCNSYSKVE